jgi:hypothetical protein
MKVHIRRTLPLLSATAVAIALMHAVAVTPASAAMLEPALSVTPQAVAHVRTHRAPAHDQQGYDEQGYGYAPGDDLAPGYAAVPREAPGGCYEDEGYGRFTPCDGGSAP